MCTVKKRIKILFVLDNLTVGGAQHIVYSIIGKLDTRRFKSVVCTLFSGREKVIENLESILKEIGIPVYRIQLSSWRDLTSFRRFEQILKKEHIDLIHAHMVPADYWGCLLGKLFGAIPTVYTRHNTYRLNGMMSHLQNFILNRVTSNKVIAISTAVFNNLTSICRVPGHRIVTIKNGVDTQRFRPEICGNKVRAELGIPPSAVVVGNTSRFEPRKGYDVFLQVAALVTEVNSHIKFLAVGHGSQEQAMKHEVTRFNLQNNVIITPECLNIPEVLAAMDIFLFTPYWGEGLPCAVLEAMACGLPVVASNVGVNPEIVKNSITGFLPSPEKWCPEAESLSSQAFANQLLFLIEHPEIVVEMGRNGRKLVLNNYNVQKMVEKHEKLYDRLVVHRV